MKHDASYILALKEATNLIDLARPSLPEARELGDSLVARCPFHAENSASLRVYPKHFHCFGCHAHGDVFSWIQRTQGLTFAQAISALGDGRVIDAPVATPKIKEQVSPFLAREREALIEVNERVTRYFQESLAANEDLWVAKCIERRLSKSAIERFRIGYAPPSSEGVLAALGDLAPEARLKSGIVGVSRTGQEYSRLADRIVIPLTNKIGQVLGLSGRKIPRLKQEHKPKYIHPSLSVAWRKSDYLYGWPSYTDEGPVYLVEGAMDAISLANVGVNNVFAVQGSSISPGQVNTIVHMGRNVIVMTDGDMPGLVAGVEIARKLFEAGVSVAMRMLGGGADPDTLARSGRLDEIKAAPVMSARWLYEVGITLPPVKDMKYDTSELDKLAAPFVERNVIDGYSHYNVVLWVVQAYPEYGPAIMAAIKAMRDDCITLPDGSRKIKEERAKDFLREWIKPSREVRRKNAGLKR